MFQVGPVGDRLRKYPDISTVHLFSNTDVALIISGVRRNLASKVTSHHATLMAIIITLPQNCESWPLCLSKTRPLRVRISSEKSSTSQFSGTPFSPWLFSARNTSTAGVRWRHPPISSFSRSRIRLRCGPASSTCEFFVDQGNVII